LDDVARASGISLALAADIESAGAEVRRVEAAGKVGWCRLTLSNPC
jgi:hypothetical protein